MFSPHKEMVIVLAIVTLANSCGCIGNRSAVYVCQINRLSTLNLTLYMSVTFEESWKMYLLNFSLKKAWYSKVKGQPQELGGGPWELARCKRPLVQSMCRERLHVWLHRWPRPWISQETQICVCIRGKA